MGPYFFPDTFHDGGVPVSEYRESKVKVWRAILRKTMDCIGCGSK